MASQEAQDFHQAQGRLQNLEQINQVLQVLQVLQEYCCEPPY